MGTLTPKNYVRNETIISMVINAVISAGLVWIVFGGASRVPVWQLGGVAFDFIPQTFMIALMSVLVPTILTRRRLLNGSLTANGAPPARLPRNPLFRAGLFALCATAILGGLAVAVLAMTGFEEIGFSNLALAKVAYGTLVALIVTPVALRAALRDAPRA